MWEICLGGPQFRGPKGVRVRLLPSSQPEEIGFMFHSVCMKEASTWSSPLAVDRCWGQPGGGSQTQWWWGNSSRGRSQNQGWKPAVGWEVGGVADGRQKIEITGQETGRESGNGGVRKQDLDVKDQETGNWESGCWGQRPVMRWG